MQARRSKCQPFEGVWEGGKGGGQQTGAEEHSRGLGELEGKENAACDNGEAASDTKQVQQHSPDSEEVRDWPGKHGRSVVVVARRRSRSKICEKDLT
jgi:hypothetical protein